MQEIDHPIFLESIQYIRNELGATDFDPLEQQVLERLIHTSGDLSIKNLLLFSPQACLKGLNALHKGSSILADTSMATVAIQSMSKRTINTPVDNLLNWAPAQALDGLTRTAIGMREAWTDYKKKYQDKNAPIVVFGSSPTALDVLLDLVDSGSPPPSLVVGMPVGFIGVLKSKKRLMNSNLPFIIIEGNRGGAALAAAAVNALLRALFLKNL